MPATFLKTKRLKKKKLFGGVAGLRIKILCWKTNQSQPFRSNSGIPQLPNLFVWTCMFVQGNALAAYLIASSAKKWNHTLSKKPLKQNAKPN